VSENGSSINLAPDAGYRLDLQLRRVLEKLHSVTPKPRMRVEAMSGALTYLRRRNIGLVYGTSSVNRRHSQMIFLAVTLTVITQAMPHDERSASSFAARSYLLETSVIANAQGTPPASGSLDELVSQTERILSLAQASKNAIRIGEATKALQNLKALRDHTAPPSGDPLNGNRGAGSGFGIAMSHIATQAATSKLQPVLEILSEMGGPVLMDRIDAYVRANAAFEAARNASAPNTSRLEQAAENARLNIMSVFSKLHPVVEREQRDATIARLEILQNKFDQECKSGDSKSCDKLNGVTAELNKYR
jgi:hypothetical protein